MKRKFLARFVRLSSQRQVSYRLRSKSGLLKCSTVSGNQFSTGNQKMFYQGIDHLRLTGCIKITLPFQDEYYDSGFPLMFKILHFGGGILVLRTTFSGMSNFYIDICLDLKLCDIKNLRSEGL